MTRPQASLRMIGLTCTVGIAVSAASLSPAHAQRPDNSPAIGSLAPDFALMTLDTTEQVTLSSYRGQMPVVLIMSSYT